MRHLRQLVRLKVNMYMRQSLRLKSTIWLLSMFIVSSLVDLPLATASQLAHSMIAVTVPPGGVASTATLNSTSCFSTVSCVSVGSYLLATGGTAPLVVVSMRGVETTTVRAPTPIASASTEMAQFSGISCVSANWCLAVGQFKSMSGPTIGFAEVGPPTSLTEISFPTINNVGSFGPWLSGVDCWSTNNCVVVGGYTDGTLHSNPILARLTATNTWAPVVTVLTFPTGISASSVNLTSVSCWASGACLLGGSYFTSTPVKTTTAFSERLTNGVLSSTTAMVSAASTYFNSLETELSCTSSTICESVVTLPGASSSFPFIQNLNGLAWTPQHGVPVPSDAFNVAHSYNYASFINCFAAFDCMIGGGYVTDRVALGSQEPYLVTYLGILGQGPNSSVGLTAPVPIGQMPSAVSGGCTYTGVCALVANDSGGAVIATGFASPGQPINIATKSKSTTTAQVTWKTPTLVGSGVSGYEVIVVHGTTMIHKYTVGRITSYLIKGLKAKQHYTIQITTHSTDGGVSTTASSTVLTL